jgi:hypothetical protein
MGQSSPFVSSCTRRQLARRRGRARRAWLWVPMPLTLGLVLVSAATAAFLAGHGIL